MVFCHCGQSFCCPPLPRFWICYFASVAMFKECGLSIINLAYSHKQSITDHVEQPDLACQRHKIIVRYRHRYAHKHLCMVLPLYSKIQVLPGITSCRLMKDNKQQVDLTCLLKNDMAKRCY